MSLNPHFFLWLALISAASRVQSSNRFLIHLHSNCTKYFWFCSRETASTIQNFQQKAAISGHPSPTIDLIIVSPQGSDVDVLAFQPLLGRKRSLKTIL